MQKSVRPLLLLKVMLLIAVSVRAGDDQNLCQWFLGATKAKSLVETIKAKAVDKTLDLMGLLKGLPKYRTLIEELNQTKAYLRYQNFGEMGLAEIGISVRYNRSNLLAMNTGRPLIIVANHHLGVADGLALQYLAGRARPETPSLLFLARWIEKILPYAVFGDQHGWGTAIPVEINLAKDSDPNFETKMGQAKAFNTSWTRTSLKVLKEGGAFIIFPAGHVAAMNHSAGEYPENIFDAANSWQDGFLKLARLGKADIVFANVKSVNGKSFYQNRKRFGGGDKERVIWFFGEALAKKSETIDVYLSKPMSLSQIYESFAKANGYSPAELETNSALTAELMRRFTYQLPQQLAQGLDTKDSPQSATNQGITVES